MKIIEKKTLLLHNYTQSLTFQDIVFQKPKGASLLIHEPNYGNRVLLTDIF